MISSVGRRYLFPSGRTDGFQRVLGAVMSRSSSCRPGPTLGRAMKCFVMSRYECNVLDHTRRA